MAAVDIRYNGRYPNSRISCILYEASAPGMGGGLPISVIDSNARAVILHSGLYTRILRACFRESESREWLGLTGKS